MVALNIVGKFTVDNRHSDARSIEGMRAILHKQYRIDSRTGSYRSGNMSDMSVAHWQR